MTSSPQEHSDVPEQLWFLCPRVHTVITPTRVTMPPKPRPKLQYIFTYPFHRSATSSDERVLAFILTFLSSKWEEQGPANQNYTFSFRYTELSWQAWANICVPSITSRVRSTLMRWKDFAEKHQIEVLDGYEVDIKEALHDSDNNT